MPQLEVFTIANATAQRVFEVLKDVEHFHEFMRDVKSVRILDRDGDKLLTEWKTDIDGTPIEWIEEDIFDEKTFTFRFKALKSNYKYEGKWQLEKISEGETKITISASFDWEAPTMEKYFGYIYKRKAFQSLRSMLNAVKKKVSVKMDRFAFLFHPYNYEVLTRKEEQSLQTKDRRFVERSLRWLSPFRRETALIKSLNGKVVAGDMIFVPLICDQILNMDPKFVLDKTIEGGELAKSLGAQIIGLGAYLSPVGRRGALISKALDMPVTSGTTFTIAMAIEAALQAAQRTGLGINKTKVAVVGATGAIGRVCSCMLSDKVEALVLVARNQERMKNLREEIMLIPHSTPNITCTDNIKEAVKQSDIVVISTNTPLEFLSVKDLNPGCVVCDVSVPHNISREDANNADVLIIDGGLVQCPNEVDFDYLDLPKGVGYACLSEVMILALEGIYENYSTGGDISIFKISEINRLAAKHGFKLAEFRSFGVSVTEDQIEKVKKARQRRIIV